MEKLQRSMEYFHDEMLTDSLMLNPQFLASMSPMFIYLALLVVKGTEKFQSGFIRTCLPNQCG